MATGQPDRAFSVAAPDLGNLSPPGRLAWCLLHFLSGARIKHIFLLRLLFRVFIFSVGFFLMLYCFLDSLLLLSNGLYL